MRPRGTAISELGRRVATVGPFLSLGNPMRGLAIGFSRVNPPDLCKPHFMCKRVISTDKVVLVSALVRTS